MATRRRARFGKRISRERWADGRSTRIIATHYHPDHLGNARVADGALRLPGGDDAGRVPDRARGAGPARDALAFADTCALFAAHGMAADFVAALAARGNAYRRGVPEAPLRFRGIIDGDDVIAGGVAVAGRSAATATRPTTRRCIRPRAACSISGDMLLPRISTNVSASPSDPDGDPLARFLESIAATRGCCRPRRWCCRRTACRFAGSRCASRNCRRITPTGWPNSQDAVDAAAVAGQRRGPGAGPVPARTRPAAAVLRDGRGDRPSQPPVARAPASGVRVAADGAIRFTTWNSR